MNKKLSMVSIVGIVTWLILSMVIGSADNLTTEKVSTVQTIEEISGVGIEALTTWNGNQWPILIAGNPVVVRGNIYSVDGTAIRINLFAKGANGNLWERYWNGNQWIWVDTGLPVAGNPVILVRGNAGSVSGSAININLFVRGTDGKLWERYWNGNQWIWANTGKSIVGDPVILVRGNVGSVSGSAIRINIFVRGTDGKLWERYWNGNQWIWANTGMPVLAAGNPVVHVRGNFYSVDGAAIRINLFVKGVDGKLWERYWDGTKWVWVNTAMPGTTSSNEKTQDVNITMEE